MAELKDLKELKDLHVTWELRFPLTCVKYRLLTPPRYEW